MPASRLPDLPPDKVVELQDALLSNADRLLASALAILDQGNIALARSLAILGLEESGKAIAIHERRVHIAYAPEGEAFVNDKMRKLWLSHPKKLRLVHDFLVREEYWFGTEPSDPAANRAYLGAIERWTLDHNTLKQRGFYVDVSQNAEVLTPAEMADEESLRDVISHVHQIGWQLRLGEHIEAKRQAEQERGQSPATAEDIAFIERALSRVENSELNIDSDFVASLLAGMREGTPGKPLNNDPYRLKLPEPGSDPFANLGKPGYEADTRELLTMMNELDRDTAANDRGDVASTE